MKKIQSKQEQTAVCKTTVTCHKFRRKFVNKRKASILTKLMRTYYRCQKKKTVNTSFILKTEIAFYHTTKLDWKVVRNGITDNI